jgi:hypothetical protein
MNSAPYTIKLAVVGVLFSSVVSPLKAETSPNFDSIATATSHYSSLKQDDAKLESDIRRFLKGVKNVNSKEEGLVSDQIIEHIAVPSEPFALHLSDSDWLISGCLPHASETKGVVIMDRFGKIKAAGLLEYIGEKDLVPIFEAWIYLRNDKSNAQYVAEIDRHFGISAKNGHKIVMIKDN